MRREEEREGRKKRREEEEKRGRIFPSFCFFQFNHCQ